MIVKILQFFCKFGKSNFRTYLLYIVLNCPFLTNIFEFINAQTGELFFGAYGIAIVFKFLRLEYLLNCENKQVITKKLRKIDNVLLDMFRNKWAEERMGNIANGKLDVLVSLKTKHEMSEYLLSRINPAHRAAISKFRLSAHKLPIETERYTQVPRADRICPLGCHSIGNEHHYLLNCVHPSMQRVYSPIINQIKTLLPGSESLVTSEIFESILNTNEYSILKLTGKLCHKVLEAFKEITW